VDNLTAHSGLLLLLFVQESRVSPVSTVSASSASAAKALWCSAEIKLSVGAAVRDVGRINSIPALWSLADSSSSSFVVKVLELWS